VTFFLGHSRMSIESLAVLPVINSLVFIFRSMGLSFQEVGIALLGENNEGYKQLRNFASYAGVYTSFFSLVPKNIRSFFTAKPFCHYPYKNIDSYPRS